MTEEEMVKAIDEYIQRYLSSAEDLLGLESEGDTNETLPS